MKGINWANICLFCSMVLWANYSCCVDNEDEEIRRQLEAEHAAFEQYKGYVSELESTFAQRIEKELDLRWSGNIHQMHGKVEDLGLHFVAGRRATIGEARALVLSIIHQYLEAINGHEKIQPYLEERPFTFKNVEISIRFEDANGTPNDGTVAIVNNCSDGFTSLNDRLIYYSHDPFIWNYVQLLEEPYEEAVRRNEATPIKNPAVHQTTEQERAVDQCFTHFIEEILREYDLECWAIGGKMDHGVEEIGANLVALQRVNQKEARQLFVGVIEKLLNRLNSSENLRPYLAEYPFPANRLKIRLCFKNNKYGVYRDGSMESVTLEGNEVTYFQKTPREEDKLVYEPAEAPVFAKEPYQEALKIVESDPHLIEKASSHLDRVYDWWRSFCCSFVIFKQF